MGKVRVESYTISLDGFGAGLDQTLESPMGTGGSSLHKWAMPTKTFRKMVFGQDGDFTYEALIDRVNGDLAHGVGPQVVVMEVFCHAVAPTCC